MRVTSRHLNSACKSGVEGRLHLDADTTLGNISGPAFHTFQPLSIVTRLSCLGDSYSALVIPDSSH